eukprot:s5001_g1.t4
MIAIDEWGDGVKQALLNYVEGLLCLAVDVLDIFPSNRWFCLCSSELGFDNAQRSFERSRLGDAGGICLRTHWMTVGEWKPVSRSAPRRNFANVPLPNVRHGQIRCGSAMPCVYFPAWLVGQNLEFCLKGALRQLVERERRVPERVARLLGSPDSSNAFEQTMTSLFHRVKLAAAPYHQTTSPVMSDAGISDLQELRPFRRVLCRGSAASGCPTRQLGPGVRHVQLDLLGICHGDGLYSCNRSVTPACAELCGEGSGSLPLEDFKRYLDEVLSTNPFEGMDEPWDVPQVDLTLSRAFIFLSQRQALYVALRTLALKMQNPQSNQSGLCLVRLMGGQPSQQLSAENPHLDIESKAMTWIQEHPIFETEVPEAKLKRSACPVVPHAFQSALTDDNFGISFKYPITATHSVDDLQDFCDSWWCVLATLPNVTFAQDENGQHIRLTFFDGKRLEAQKNLNLEKCKNQIDES